MMFDASSGCEKLRLAPFLQGVSLVVGKPSSGKSLFLKFLAENAVISQHSVGILDPNGDHADLNVVDVSVFGEVGALPDSMGLDQMLREFRTGFVLDLSRLGPIEKSDYLNSALNVIIPFKNETGRPTLLMVDEAHGLSRLESDQAKFNLVDGVCFSSFIPSGISTPIITSVTTFVVNVTSFEEVKKLHSRVRHPSVIDACLEAIRKLSPEDAFAIVSEHLEAPVIIKFSTMIRHLKSRHIRQRNMFWSGSLLKEECFYFIEPDTHAAVRANNLQEFCQVVEVISVTSLIHHLLNHDLSRWAENVIGDKELARQFAAIEAGVNISSIGQIRVDLCSAVQSRYAPPPQVKH